MMEEHLNFINSCGKGLQGRGFCRQRAMRKRKRNNFFFVRVACYCGLCLPNMITTKANAKENLGDVFGPFHFESESEKKEKIPRFQGRFLAERISLGFLALGRRIFSRIWCRRIFLLISVGKVPRKILQENPRQNSRKFIQQTSPTHISAARGPIEAIHNREVEIKPRNYPVSKWFCDLILRQD